jgi:hypothetical protein
LTNFYITERYLFANFYKKPPLFDNAMNARALSLIQYAPVMMALFGYWHMGNHQIFFNEVELRKQKNQILDPMHPLLDYS